MSNWKPTNGEIGGQAISATSTTKNHTLGRIICARDFDVSTLYGEGEFIYLLGVASTVVGSLVTWSSDDFQSALAVSDDVGPLALAMSINVAGPNYGWYQMQGKGVAKVTAGLADDADMYLTSVGGVPDSTNVSGDYINGMRSASAIGTPDTGLAEMELWRPFVRDLKDD